MFNIVRGLRVIKMLYRLEDVLIIQIENDFLDKLIIHNNYVENKNFIMDNNKNTDINKFQFKKNLSLAS